MNPIDSFEWGAERTSARDEDEGASQRKPSVSTNGLNKGIYTMSPVPVLLQK